MKYMILLILILLFFGCVDQLHTFSPVPAAINNSINHTYKPGSDPKLTSCTNNSTPCINSTGSVSLSSSKCHLTDGLPDPICTPGVVDSNITQTKIKLTICVSGYTSKVRPTTSYTNKLKAQGIIDYGYADTNMSDYEEDHLISLELGGSPTDPRNLFPEPWDGSNGAHAKDLIENRCHKKVCDGSITLIDAQNQIASNWKTACQ